VQDHECSRHAEIGAENLSDEPADDGAAANSGAGEERKYRASRPITSPTDHPRPGRARSDDASGGTPSAAHRGARLAISKHASGPLLPMA